MATYRPTSQLLLLECFFSSTRLLRGVKSWNWGRCLWQVPLALTWVNTYGIIDWIICYKKLIPIGQSSSSRPFQNKQGCHNSFCTTSGFQTGQTRLQIDQNGLSWEPKKMWIFFAQNSVGVCPKKTGLLFGLPSQWQWDGLNEFSKLGLQHFLPLGAMVEPRLTKAKNQFGIIVPGKNQEYR